MIESNMTDIMATFLETAMDYFGRLRALETDYNENILAITLSYLASVDEDDQSPFVQLLVEDKDALSNSLSGSHFARIQVTTFIAIEIHIGSWIFYNNCIGKIPVY